MRIALALRGHVRDGFDTPALREFVAAARGDGSTEVDLFVHTWHRKEAALAHRPATAAERDRSREVVTPQTVAEYFGEQPVWVEVQRDDEAVLHGLTVGVIPSTICNRAPWKRMWHGKKRVADAVPAAEGGYDVVVSMRIDLFTRLETPPTFAEICAVAARAAATRTTLFLRPWYVHGIDNCYCSGDIPQWKADVTRFFEDVDGIAARRADVRFQERLVFEEMTGVAARSELMVEAAHLSGATWNTRSGWKGPETQG